MFISDGARELAQTETHLRRRENLGQGVNVVRRTVQQQEFRFRRRDALVALSLPVKRLP